MAWRIVKQPDGKYARFSEVVDDFTHDGMTRTQVYKLCRVSLGEGDSAQKIDNADKELIRWAEAICIICDIHGKDVAERRVATQWK